MVLKFYNAHVSRYVGPSPYAKAAPQVRPTLQKIAPSAGLAPAHRSALPPQEPKWPNSESSEATLPRLFQTGESGSEYLTIPQRELTCMRRKAFALGLEPRPDPTSPLGSEPTPTPTLVPGHGPGPRAGLRLVGRNCYFREVREL